ncbi:MAG: GntR family transcriptional regulator [Ndongobacter sp.]|nr:GntR family transcriptional regulator [Ndongobacter sp.]
MDPVSLKEKAFSHVLSGIIQGEYTTSGIITEKELCEKLNMSKSPVREALVELCSQNILRSIPRHGYAVVQYTETDIANIIQFRILLECGVLEQCFDRITATQVCVLSNIVELEFSTLHDMQMIDYWRDTMNFHLTLVSFSNNEFIYNQLRSALSTILRAYLQLYWQDSSIAKPSELHRQIVQAIRAGDKALAVSLLKQDIQIVASWYSSQVRSKAAEKKKK